MNSLTAKLNGIPNLNPPSVQPSADHCISLCPGSTRPDILSMWLLRKHFDGSGELVPVALASIMFLSKLEGHPIINLYHSG